MSGCKSGCKSVCKSLVVKLYNDQWPLPTMETLKLTSCVLIIFTVNTSFLYNVIFPDSCIGLFYLLIII